MCHSKSQPKAQVMAAVAVEKIRHQQNEETENLNRRNPQIVLGEKRPGELVEILTPRSSPPVATGCDNWYQRRCSSALGCRRSSRIKSLPATTLDHVLPAHRLPVGGGHRMTSVSRSGAVVHKSSITPLWSIVGGRFGVVNHGAAETFRQTTWRDRLSVGSDWRR